jgi:hypothetical protein
MSHVLKHCVILVVVPVVHAAKRYMKFQYVRATLVNHVHFVVAHDVSGQAKQRVQDMLIEALSVLELEEEVVTTTTTTTTTIMPPTTIVSYLFIHHPKKLLQHDLYTR